MRKLMRSILAVLASVAIGSAQNAGVSRFLEYPITVPDRIFKAQKFLNPVTGRIEIKLLQDGQALGNSLAMLEQQEAAAKKAMFGNLSQRVFNRLSATEDQDMRVAVYLCYSPITYPDKTKQAPDEQASSSLASLSLHPIASAADVALSDGLTGMEPRGDGLLVGRVTRQQLETLKYDANVAAVEEVNDEMRLSVDMTTLPPSAYNPGPVPSSSGYGVRAGTFETGLTSAFLNCIGVTPVAWDANVSSSPDDPIHANTAFRMLVATAPSAGFYHRRSDYYSGTPEQSYIISNGIQTLSMSVGRGGSTPDRSTNAEFLVMDDFAYRYPYPVFVNPAGNSGYGYEVNWQCYNAISVGNVRNTSNTTYEMANCTQAKNPPPVYGGCIAGSDANCAGDREMPYVVVPGIPSSGTDFAVSCVGDKGAGATLGCGTSWSAPIGNGLAADVISADSRLVSWPEKVRATLILTAQNVDGGNWSSNTDGRDGAGVVSGSTAVAFAQGHTSVSPGNTAVDKGMAAGSMYATDFNGSNKRFYYLVPNPAPSGMHLRVVLTWDSNPIVGGSTNALSDLDLIVQKNGGTQGSYSWDGNVEVVDLAATDVTPGSSYYIDIAPAINRIPTSGARTNFFYYSLAWAWVKDHAN